MKKKTFSVIGVILIFFLSYSANAQKNTAETYRQLDLFGDVFERVRTDYVKQVEDKKLIESAINGMLTSLDPRSSYMSPKKFKAMQIQTKGEFGGLGIEVTMENGFVKIVSPIDDTPAFRAGLKSGDLISHLDGQPVQGLTLAQAVEKMRGKVKTKIRLMVRRNTLSPFEVTITRAIIKIRSVRHRIEGEIGYLRVTSFTENTKEGITRNIKTMRESLGEKLKGLVVDLRNNPGGLLDEAIKVADAFLDRGEIVSTRSRRANDTQRYNAKPGDLVFRLPIVVLINGGSASASEIVAGALQDHHRAVILGTRSFGKGSVQTIIPLAGHGAIRLTTAEYFTPSGRSIQAKGIKPDIEVKQARIESFEPQSGRREADLRGALSNPNSPIMGDKDKKTNISPNKTTKPNKKDKPFDYQLERAFDLIRGISLYDRHAKE